MRAAPPFLSYSLAESDEAMRSWKAACGHHSIAAAAKVSLSAIKTACPRLCGWMNREMIQETLTRLGVRWMRYQLAAVDHNPGALKAKLNGRSAVMRLQWVGSWQNAQNERASYLFTHYVGVREDHVLDIMHDSVCWLDLETWWATEQERRMQVERASGWYITDVWCGNWGD